MPSLPFFVTFIRREKRDMLSCKEALDILKKADELLSDETKWTIGAMGRTKDKVPVSVRSKNVVSFCLLGSIYKVYSNTDNIAASTAITIFNMANQTISISKWNDEPERTFPEVKEALKKAIAYGETKLKEQES